MAIKKVSGALVVAAIFAASYWYFSPYVSINQMRSAAQSGDAESFNAHVDYPKLRTNVKDQFSKMASDIASSSSAESDSAKSTGAAIGSMIGMTLADRMVDGLLRPEFVMKAMQDGKWGKRVPAKPGAASSESTEPKWTSERQGMNKFIVHLYGSEFAMGPKETGFVFERSGFAHWMLTDVRLPMKAHH
jgi:hypothetical protein